MDELLCFCTEKTKKEVKKYIRENVNICDKVDNDLIFKVHKSFADGQFMGRCCGCIDEVEELVMDYKQGKWE